MSRFRDENDLQSWTQELTAGVDFIDDTINVNNSRYMIDEVSPNYFSLLKSGGFLPINDMQRGNSTSLGTRNTHEWRVVDQFGQVQALTKIRGNLAAAMGWTLGYDNLSLPWLGDPVDLPDPGPLVTEALANVSTSSFDAGTFVAEVHKTIGLIRTARKRVFARAENIVHSRKGTIAQRGLAGFHETWLEGRYGWRQIFFDFEAINESIERLGSLTSPFVRGAKRERNIATYLVTSVGDFVVTANSPETLLTSNNISRISGTIVQEYTREAAGGVVLDSLAQNLAFCDPFVTGWEVVPFSFIADWFFTIGKNIEAYSPFATGNLLGAWTSVEDTITTVYSASMSLSDDYGHKAEIDGGRTSLYTSEVKAYSRLKVTPSFNVTVDINITPAKILDLVAIFGLKYMRLLGNIRKLARV